MRRILTPTRKIELRDKLLRSYRETVCLTSEYLVETCTPFDYTKAPDYVTMEFMRSDAARGYLRATGFTLGDHVCLPRMFDGKFASIELRIVGAYANGYAVYAACTLIDVPAVARWYLTIDLQLTKA